MGNVCWTECWKCDYHIILNESGFNECEIDPQQKLFLEGSMAEKERIVKVKLKDKETGKEGIIVMGNNYRSFDEHFSELIDHYTDKWEMGRGRTLKVEVVEMSEANERFVSMDCPKWKGLFNYNEKVIKHNQAYPDYPCKQLFDIKFIPIKSEGVKKMLTVRQVIN